MLCFALVLRRVGKQGPQGRQEVVSAKRKLLQLTAVKGKHQGREKKVFLPLHRLCFNSIAVASDPGGVLSSL